MSVGGGGQPTALAEITQLDPIYVNATLSEQQVLEIRANIDQRRLTPADLLKVPVDVGLQNGTELSLSRPYRIRRAAVRPHHRHPRGARHFEKP